MYIIKIRNLNVHFFLKLLKMFIKHILVCIEKHHILEFNQVISKVKNKYKKCMAPLISIYKLKLYLKA